MALERTSSSEIRGTATALALTPLVAAAVLLGVAPSHLEALLSRQVSIAGLPFGLVLLGLAVVLQGLSVVVAQRARSAAVAALGAAVLALPALLIVLLGPALVLAIMRAGNLE